MLSSLLEYCVRSNCSDLHLSAGMPPMVRLDGDLQRLEAPSLDNASIREMLKPVMPARQQQEFLQCLATDFSFEVPDLARFRINVFTQDRGIAAAIRMIPNRVQSIEALKLPAIFKDLAVLPRGLVLVTGPTGSGKSTSLAAMVDYINHQSPSHILTIEDPIEFVYQSQKSLINQREVHRDTLGFSESLRSSLREDPDVILVGELRDLETIRLAISAAETGHLVFATLHTNSATKSINRLIDVFPGDEKPMIRSMLSESLQAVVSQHLVKKIGGGRIPAFEIMICNAAIRNLIREDKVAQMYSTIQTGQAQGMMTLDQSLSQLVKNNSITQDSASAIAVNKALFQ